MTYAAPAPTEPYLVLTPAGVLRAESDFPPGGPQAPLDEDAVVAKFHSLADPVVGAASAERLRSTVWMLESAPRVTGLIGHS